MKEQGKLDLRPGKEVNDGAQADLVVFLFLLTPGCKEGLLFGFHAQVVTEESFCKGRGVFRLQGQFSGGIQP